MVHSSIPHKCKYAQSFRRKQIAVYFTKTPKPTLNNVHRSLKAARVRRIVITTYDSDHFMQFINLLLTPCTSMQSAQVILIATLLGCHPASSPATFLAVSRFQPLIQFLAVGQELLRCFLLNCSLSFSTGLSTLTCCCLSQRAQNGALTFLARVLIWLGRLAGHFSFVLWWLRL